MGSLYSGGTYNEQVISSAKALGKGLFSDLPLEERKDKINEQVIHMFEVVFGWFNIRSTVEVWINREISLYCEQSILVLVLGKIVEIVEFHVIFI